MLGRYMLLAFRSLRRAPVRTALTMVGIIIGISAVILTASIGHGAELRIKRLLGTAESRTVYVTATTTREAKLQGVTALPKRDQIDLDDYSEVRRSLHGVALSSPRLLMMRARAHANGRSDWVRVDGVDVDDFQIAPRTITYGALFTQIDVARASNVVLINEGLAELLRARVGSHIRVQGVPFTVLGFLLDTPVEQQEPQNRVVVPYTAFLKRLDPLAAIHLSIQARKAEDVPSIQKSLVDLLESRRGIRRGFFQTTTAADSLAAYASGSQTVARFLAVIGAISLLVGGVGIMNIMLASVAERTREIGIRIAIGCRSHQVLLSFLAESTIIGVCGGAIGVIVGVAASHTVGWLSGWPVDVQLTSIIGATGYSVLIGWIFGIQPAKRAASLNPVDALRSDHF